MHHNFRNPNNNNQNNIVWLLLAILITLFLLVGALHSYASKSVKYLRLKKTEVSYTPKPSSSLF